MLRVVVPLVAVGLILLAISLVFVGRDLTFARNEAEAEVLAFAEASARAIQFAPSSEVDPYLSGLVKHPAIAMVTVYSSNGQRQTKRRPTGTESSFIDRVVPSLREPVVGCRAVGATSVCMEADMTYYQRRLAALLVPHLILLTASGLLLIVAIVLGRGSNRRQLEELTRIARGAVEQSDYSLRATEGSGQMGELSRTMNRLLEHMHQRDLILRRRTTELETLNREMEAFSYSVSHDLRSPLASVDGFAEALAEGYSDSLDEAGKEYLQWIRDAAEQMKDLISGLMQMSRVTRAEIKRTTVDLSEMAEIIAQTLLQRRASRSVEFRIEPNLTVGADERLLHAALENLMSNAFKYSGKKEHAIIEVGRTQEGGRRTYFVRDNGAGFDSTQAARMFTAFQRLHSSSEFEGTGIGLATVKRIIERHGGAIWADSQVGQGATFYFTLGEASIAGDSKDVTELSRV